MNSPPSAEVLAAFGIPNCTPTLAPGGQGDTFRCDHFAIKRCDDPVQTEWLSSILEGLSESGFRVARPVRSVAGTFVFQGWSAAFWLEGSTSLYNRWHQAMDAIQAFHRALAPIPFPPQLYQTDDPWRNADAVVWSDNPQLPLGPPADRLVPLLRPVTLPSQLIQGDPSEGNILFAENQPTAIIDIAPYWHPADYSIAMFIADSIAWSKAPHDLLPHVAAWPQMKQLLLRAVLFRLYVGYLFRGGPTAAARRAEAYAPVIHFIETHPGP